MSSNKETRRDVTKWTCPLCKHIEYTTDPRVVRLHCPGCFRCSWMCHNEEVGDGREEKEK